jgi:hypothetical protein
MRYAIPATFILVLFLGASQAQAKSCSSFLVIESYDAASGTVKVDHGKGSVRKFFPKPEGAPSDTTKIPGSCKSREKQDELAVKSSGGRMSITQIRTNFEGRMLNDVDNQEWFAGKMKELIDGKTEVVAVIRPGMKKDECCGRRRLRSRARV